MENGIPGNHVASEVPSRSKSSRRQALIGTTIDNRYLIEAVLGEGAMATVYAARHTALDRRVAVKVLHDEHAEDSEILERFAAEARAASAIESEHIVATLDFGVLAQGSLYLVMEYLEGSTLTTLLKRRCHLSFAEISVLVRQVAEGLDAAHRAGIVHRDLKPDNILLVRGSDGRPFAKILDFGIAKMASKQKRLTRAGQIFGTPCYMSPEQARGDSIDGRSDLYSLGVILYELATGNVPFDAEGPMEVLSQHVHAKLPPLKSRLPQDEAFPPGFDRVVEKCLKKNPDLRYRTLPDLLKDWAELEAGLAAPATRGTLPSTVLSSVVPLGIRTPGAAAESVRPAPSVRADSVRAESVRPAPSVRADNIRADNIRAESPRRDSAPSEAAASELVRLAASWPPSNPRSSMEPSTVSVEAISSPTHAPPSSRGPAPLEAGTYRTTLGSGLSQDEIRALRPRSKFAKVLAQGFVLLAVGLGGALLAARFGGTSNQTAAAAAATVYVPVPAASVAAHPPGTLQVHLVVLPLDAHAYRGDEDLGTTPIVVDVTPGKVETLVLKRAGFETQRVRLDGKRPRVIVHLPKTRGVLEGSTSDSDLTPPRAAAAPAPARAAELAPRTTRSGARIEPRTPAKPRRDGVERPATIESPRSGPSSRR